MRTSPSTPRAPESRSSPRPDFFPGWTGPFRKPRPVGRDLCVACACLTMLLYAARALGYV
ncbi:MAG: hypothetical protein R3B57_00690 [Phycisphaerales bacterium]